MRWCPVCSDEMSPEFGSSCEDPIAWACRACGFMQLETGGRPLGPEQAGAVPGGAQRLAPAAPGERAPQPAGVRAAREILSTFNLAPPVDIERAATLLGYPVEWVRRPAHERGGIARRPGGDTLLVNRDYPFRSAAEWRWVVAEELGHAILEHSALAASREPGGPPALYASERRREEGAAKAFAAELLMPADEVRAEFRRAHPARSAREREEGVRQIVFDLAHAFQVSPTAMRVRLETLGLLH